MPTTSLFFLLLKKAHPVKQRKTSCLCLRLFDLTNVVVHSCFQIAQKTHTERAHTPRTRARTHTRARMHTHADTHDSAHTHTHASARAHTYRYTRQRTHTRARAHTQRAHTPRTNAHKRARVHVHTHTHTTFGGGGATCERRTYKFTATHSIRPVDRSTSR